MTHYFIKDGKIESGPFTKEQLKYGDISRDTPIWFAGLEEWTTAEQVYELREIFRLKKSGKKFSLSSFWKSLFKKNYDKKTYQLVVSKERNREN